MLCLNTRSRDADHRLREVGLTANCMLSNGVFKAINHPKTLYKYTVKV